MGKDESTWCAYHRLRGYNTKNCHQLKKQIEILIQRGQLLSYVKDMGGQPGKRSPPREDRSSEDPTQKKWKNTEEVYEARITCHTLNTITWRFTGGGETKSARKIYARQVMHIEQKPPSVGKEFPVMTGFSIRDSKRVLSHENNPMVIKI